MFSFMNSSETIIYLQEQNPQPALVHRQKMNKGNFP